jgi:hypothetical protein
MLTQMNIWMFLEHEVLLLFYYSTHTSVYEKVESISFYDDEWKIVPVAK